MRVIESHTGGEPTRLIVDGGPDLGTGDLARRLGVFRRDHDHVRTAVCAEPRGWDVTVGGVVCEPVDSANTAGVIFFNNVGYLGMCGHGTMGLVATLVYLGRMEPGVHGIETPVGTVRVTLHDDGRVAVRNVPAYRLHKGVRVEVPGHGAVTGDVAWGGNWFFICEDHGQVLSLDRSAELMAFAARLRALLAKEGLTGADGAEIDHVELVTPSPTCATGARNFVLCPGLAWDRSPCGTGTSARLACLAADGKLEPGEEYRQESVLGSVFEARYEPAEAGGIGRIIPTITGRAYVNADVRLIFSSDDPFAHGIRRKERAR